MKHIHHRIALFALAGALSASAQATAPVEPTGRWSAPPPGAAITPPMGWSSWNAFRTKITEDKVVGSAEALVRTGLAKLGYRYVNIDDGWWLKRSATDGRLEVRTQIFPSANAAPGARTSLRPLVDRLHAMGLRAGIYTDIGRNACSQAYDLSSPNLPVGTTAEREVGLYDHVDQDMRLFFGDWKFDYVKVDACGVADYGPEQAYVSQQAYRPFLPAIVRGQPARTDVDRIRSLYTGVAAALRRYGSEDSILSICTWGQADVREWGKDVGNAWRTSEDITPHWSSMLQSFDSAAGRALYAHPGAWNDPDMLFVGTGEFDEHHLTEARSHFSLWAIINAPLMIGYDLRNAPKALLDIWGNAEVVAINQDPAGNQATLAYRSDDLQILVKTLTGGRKAVAVFNRTNAPVSAVLTADHLRLSTAMPIRLTDVWDRTASLSFTREAELKLTPHETRLFVADGRRALATGYYLSELPGSINVAVDGVRQSELDPTIYRGVSPWAGSRSDGERPAYGGWGGAQPDSAPYGSALTVAGRIFQVGIGILSDSRMEVKNDGYRRFSASVGVDDSTRNRRSAVTFAVYGDGRLLASTKPMRFGEPARPLAANIDGVKVVELVARSIERGEEPTAVSWGAAALTNGGAS